jgi:hypothetical protein
MVVTLAQALSSKIDKIDWCRKDEFTELGSLSALLHVVAEETTRARLQVLGAVTAKNTPHRKKPIPSLSIFFALQFLQEEKKGSGEDSPIITSTSLVEFYNFQLSLGVSDDVIRQYIKDNHSLVVVRKKYTQPTSFILEIVGAITFTMPLEGSPVYIAYLAVADERNGQPRLVDTSVHTIPFGSISREDMNSYQGFGIATLLIALTGRVVASVPGARGQPVPHCFLHYNTRNNGAQRGWEKRGFQSVETKQGPEGTAARNRLLRLRAALTNCPIFTVCDTDTINCRVMYRQIPVHDSSMDPTQQPTARAIEPNRNDWYKAYTSVDVDPVFKATVERGPTEAYCLSNPEIQVKYAAPQSSRQADLGFILEMAQERKVFRLKHDNAAIQPSITTATSVVTRYPKRSRTDNAPTIPSKFSDQAYIDYACLQDPNRSLRAALGSHRKTACGEVLVTVVVSGYLLPVSTSLETIIENTIELAVADRTVECNWYWLAGELVPELAQILKEAIFGTSVLEGIGRDDPSPWVATRDAASMASFLGHRKLVHGFVAPPAMHRKITLPSNDFTESGYLIAHKKECKLFKRHVMSLGIPETPPPLPRQQHQISRLRWIPTQDPLRNKYTVGYFQGIYTIPETKEFSEVSLLDPWVLHQFDATLLQEVKEQGVTGSRAASRRFITIPPGNANKATLPPDRLLCFMRRSIFQQGSGTTCLLDCFSSAMHDFGCVDNVLSLRRSPETNGLNQVNTNMWADFGNIVNRCFKGVGLQFFRQKNARLVSDLLECDDSFVIVATLNASDGMSGQHAITLFEGGIYDANCPFVLKKTQESLDWCCGEGSTTCVGIHRSYQMLPTHHRDVSSELKFVFQCRNHLNRNVRGWVSSSKGRLPRIQFADGEMRVSSSEEIGTFPRVG